MATSFNSSIFSTTYKDDYDDSDAYYRVLFNAGRALQARELTQMQTIINKEMERFGKNIFKEGACVSGSSLTINKSYDFIKITSIDTAVITNTNDLIGKEYVGTTSGVTFRVLEYYTAAQTGVNDTIYVQYIGGTASGAYTKATDAEDFYVGGVSGTYDLTSVSSNAIGTGTRLSVGRGAFFSQGHFVHAREQSIILRYYSNNYSGTIGFKVTQDIVTATDNSALYDNQGVTPNTSAPGADRYRIKLDLIKEEDVAADEDFIYYATIKNSNIIAQISATDQYNKINDLMAKRTFEESGNYIVSPFKANYSTNDSDDEVLDLNVSAGIAYVNGYRAEGQTSVKIPVAKPTETLSETSVGIPANYGNYVICDSGSTLTIPNLSSFTKTNILDSAGVARGSVSVRAIKEDAANVNLYLFDTKMNANKIFERDARKIGDSANDAFAIVTEPVFGTSRSIIKQPRDNNLFFELPRSRPKTLATLSHTEQRLQTGTSTGGGQATVTVTGETLTDTDLWIATLADGTRVQPTIVSSSSTSVTVGGLGASQDYNLAYYVQKGISRRAKTLTTQTKTSTTASDYVDSDGISYLSLGYGDIFNIVSIKDSASGDDIADNFIIDDGQRDNYYQYGRLILKPGITKPAKTYCQFKYFNHGAGDYFDVASYPVGTGASDINYGQIPTFNSPSQGNVSLRDVLDYRPLKQGHVPGAAFTNINQLPRSGDVITATTVETYLPRLDKIVVDENGSILSVQGASSLNPKFPATPAGSLLLYKVALNPNTVNDSDLTVNPIDHKRYRMEDIAKLDTQVQRLEELTSLTMLELDTKNLQVLDSTGAARTKAGFLVDNFSDQAFADTKDPSYNASIDPRAKLLRPSFIENNVKLVYDSDNSTNVTRVGDYLMLTHDSAEWQSINICSGTENINPFNVTSSKGSLKLSPASDEWRDVTAKADKVVSGGTRLDTTQAYLWNNWEWNWGGIALDDLEVGAETNRSLTSTTIKKDYRTAMDKRADYWGDDAASPRYKPEYETEVTTTSTAVNRIVSSETIRESLGTRVVDTALVPWMRSRKIFFKATNLRPSTRYFPYFDNKQVDTWCKSESSFVNYGSDSADLGNEYDTATTHPDGSGTLVSDANGQLIGSFFIPYKQFKTGTKMFKLLDVSGGLDNQALSRATAAYSAVGHLDTVQETIRSTRVLTVDGDETSSESSRPISKPIGIRPPVKIMPMPIKLPNPAVAFDPGTIATVPDADPIAQFFELNSTFDALHPRVDIKINDGLAYDADLRAVAKTNTGLPVKVFNKSSYLRCGYIDPLAQTFFVNDITGVFITSVDIYFKTRDTSLPVELQIRPVVNGQPSSEKVLASVTLPYSSVNVVTTQTVAGVLAKPTQFNLEEPLYLSPQQEYAIVIMSTSNKYNVYVSEVGEFQLGSANKRITTQPSLGSLFKSQNGKTWEPDQKKDLMMKLYRATFNKTHGEARLRTSNVPLKLLKRNPLRTTAGDSDVVLYAPNHGLNVGDTFYLTGLADNTKYGGLRGYNLKTARTVTQFDANGIIFKADSTATATTYVGGNNVKLKDGNIQFNIAKVDVQTMTPGNETNVMLRAKFTSGRSSTGKELRMISDSQWQQLRFGQNTSFTSPKMIANRTRENLSVTGDSASGLGGGRSVNISLPMVTNSNFVSPIIDLQRASITTIENAITNTAQDVYTIDSAAETNAYGGSEVARHVSIPAVLANASVGIKVFLAVNRPSVCDVDLYYRVGNENADLKKQAWVKLNPLATPPPDDNPSVFRDYEYLAGGDNGVLDEFTRMQFKIVMRSTNSSKVPKIRDFRAIALID